MTDTLPADEAMKKAVDAMVSEGVPAHEGCILDMLIVALRALDSAGYEVRAKGVTSEMISAAATSQATGDEGTFPLLMDLINFSGENKTRTVIRAALESALAAAPKLVEVKP